MVRGQKGTSPKGINEEQCNKLWSFVQLKDKPRALYEQLLKNEEIMKMKKAKPPLRKWAFYSII